MDFRAWAAATHLCLTVIIIFVPSLDKKDVFALHIF